MGSQDSHHLRGPCFRVQGKSERVLDFVAQNRWRVAENRAFGFFPQSPDGQPVCAESGFGDSSSHPLLTWRANPANIQAVAKLRLDDRVDFRLDRTLARPEGPAETGSSTDPGCRSTLHRTPADTTQSYKPQTA